MSKQIGRRFYKDLPTIHALALLAYYSASASLEATDACLMARFLARDSERRSLSSLSLAINSLWYSAASVFFCTRQMSGHCRVAQKSSPFNRLRMGVEG